MQRCRWLIVELLTDYGRWLTPYISIFLQKHLMESNFLSKNEQVQRLTLRSNMEHSNMRIAYRILPKETHLLNSLNVLYFMHDVIWESEICRNLKPKALAIEWDENLMDDPRSQKDFLSNGVREETENSFLLLYSIYKGENILDQIDFVVNEIFNILMEDSKMETIEEIDPRRVYLSHQMSIFSKLYNDFPNWETGERLYGRAERVDQYHPEKHDKNVCFLRENSKDHFTFYSLGFIQENQTLKMQLLMKNVTMSDLLKDFWQ
ncbi:unnamed protein product, partial [Mesorhabditis belari]|uniref:Uncharacterized protein n=1 Tax=Mesorhabditis belari TaxID=2138241 RepID=A0AAF3FRD4_9BILA